MLSAKQIAELFAGEMAEVVVSGDPKGQVRILGYVNGFPSSSSGAGVLVSPYSNMSTDRLKELRALSNVVTTVPGMDENEDVSIACTQDIKFSKPIAQVFAEKHAGAVCIGQSQGTRGRVVGWDHSPVFGDTIILETDMFVGVPLQGVNVTASNIRPDYCVHALLEDLALYKPAKKDTKAPGVDLSHYPRTCPFCASRAYIGANTVSCSNTKCEHADPKLKQPYEWVAIRFV